MHHDSGRKFIVVESSNTLRNKSGPNDKNLGEYYSSTCSCSRHHATTLGLTPWQAPAQTAKPALSPHPIPPTLFYQLPRSRPQ